MLCKVCQDLFRRQWTRWTQSDPYLSAPQGHQPNLESFYKSVGEACQICTLLCDSSKIQKAIARLPTSHSSHLIMCQRHLYYPTPYPTLRCFQLNFIADSAENIYSRRPSGDADASFVVAPSECKYPEGPIMYCLRASPRLHDQ